MEKKLNYTPTQNVLLFVSIFLMPVVAFLSYDIDPTLWIGYMALWFTITMQFAWLNIKLRKYREHYWEQNIELKED